MNGELQLTDLVVGGLVCRQELPQAQRERGWRYQQRHQKRVQKSAARGSAEVSGNAASCLMHAYL